jgi:diguanylate cyclase (GGDEF)-like protein
LIVLNHIFSGRRLKSGLRTRCLYTLMTRPHRLSEPDFRARYGVLLDIGRVLTGTRQDELYRTIYEQASRVLETTGFYISLYDADQDEGRVVFYADRGEIERPDITYRGSDSRAIREGRGILEEVSGPERAIMLLGPDNDDEVTRSVMAAPMRSKGQVVGVISSQSYRRAAYTAADLELLEAIADLAAGAISNARSMAELDRQRRESQQLEELGRALSASLELDEVLQRIVTASRMLIEGDGSAVWFLLEDGRAQNAMTSGEASLPVGITIPVSDELRRRFAHGREPLIVNRAVAAAILPPEVLAEFKAASALAVPLIAEDHLIGALAVSHLEPRTYPASDIRLLERLGYQAAIAVANARLHEQVRLLSLTDPLTGLPNRRHMDIFLQKEFAAAERGRALTVVLFDLNDFKQYNDAAGHQAGDGALRRFASLLADQTRAMNLAARYGGDEFIAILSDTPADGAAIWVDRFLSAVHDDHEMAGVGASAGIAAYEKGMLGPADLIRAADEELYRSKADRERRMSTP